jgi:hypothetical protein
MGLSASPRASPRPGCQSSELCGLPPAYRAVELQASYITLNLEPMSLYFSPSILHPRPQTAPLVLQLLASLAELEAAVAVMPS